MSFPPVAIGHFYNINYLRLFGTLPLFLHYFFFGFLISKKFPGLSSHTSQLYLSLHLDFFRRASKRDLIGGQYSIYFRTEFDNLNKHSFHPYLYAKWFTLHTLSPRWINYIWAKPNNNEG